MKTEWAAWVGFGATVVPLVGAAGIGTLLGALWIAPRLSSGVLDLAVLLLAGLSYIGVILTAERAILSSSMLIGFGVFAGGILGRWLPGLGDGTWARAVAVGTLLLMAAFLVGQWGERWLAAPTRWLWLGSWLYLAGWIVLGLWRMPLQVSRTWAMGGVALFGGLAAGWFASVEVGEGPGTPRHAASLYLIGLNVVIAFALAVGLGG